MNLLLGSLILISLYSIPILIVGGVTVLILKKINK